MFKIVQKIGNSIHEPSSEVLAALEESKKKLLLFMGHVHRAHLQDKRIQEIMRKLCNMDAGRGAVLFLDYKMKQLPIRFRETTTEFWYVMAWNWRVLCHRRK